MHKIILALAFASAALIASPASADPAAEEAAALAALEAELPGTLMNNPIAAAWKTFGDNKSIKVVKVDEIPGQRAYEVRMKQAGRNPWDVSATVPLSAGVESGDAVLVAFWARATSMSPVTGASNVQVRVQQTAAPYTGVAEGMVSINDAWQLHYVKGISPSAFEAKDIAIAFNAGHLKQTVQFGQFYVMNLGQGVSLDNLPSDPEDL